jgi:hypothetical protein
VIAPGPSRRLLNLLPQKMFPGRRWKSPGFSHSNKNILVVKFTVYLIGRSNFPVTGYNKCMIFESVHNLTLRGLKQLVFETI